MKAIIHNILKYFSEHVSTGISLKFLNSERSPPIKAGVTLAVFKLSGKIFFSSIKFISL